uniref:Uncharacterized protein n=1 Tax=Ananas comosus var. bracteatus TaxID=296719 RepID=A0A6V7PGV8_ANACO|nr:unnamed protein product [Ananas comosus var. bracteatus]
MVNGTKLQQQTTSYNQSLEEALQSAQDVNQKLDVLIEALQKEEARRHEITMQENARRHEQLLELIRSRFVHAREKEIAVQVPKEEKELIPITIPLEKRVSSLTNSVIDQPAAVKEVEQKHLEILQMEDSNGHDVKLSDSTSKPERLLRLHATQPYPTKPIPIVETRNIEHSSSERSKLRDNIVPSPIRANMGEGTPLGTHKLQEMEEEAFPQWPDNNPLPQQPWLDQIHHQHQQHKLQKRSIGRGTYHHCRHLVLRSKSSLKVATQLGTKSGLDRPLVAPQSSSQPTKSPKLQLAMDATQIGPLQIGCYHNRVVMKIGPLQTGKAKIEKQEIVNYKDKPPWKEFAADRWKGIDIKCLTDDIDAFCRQIHNKTVENYQARSENLTVQKPIQNSNLVEACQVWGFVNEYKELGTMLKRPHPCSRFLTYEQDKLQESDRNLGVTLHIKGECKALTMIICKWMQAVQNRSEEDHLLTEFHTSRAWQVDKGIEQFTRWSGIERDVHQLVPECEVCLRAKRENRPHIVTRS